MRAWRKYKKWKGQKSALALCRWLDYCDAMYDFRFDRFGTLLVEKLMEDLEKDKLTPPEWRQVLAECMQVAAQESKIVHGSIIALTDGDNDKGHIHLDGVALAAEGKTGVLFGLLANIISVIAYRSDMSIDDALDKIQFYLDQNR